jgi:hypothetical protein
MNGIIANDFFVWQNFVILQIIFEKKSEECRVPKNSHQFCEFKNLNTPSIITMEIYNYVFN